MRSPLSTYEIGWISATHLDLQVEVGSICDLGLEHGAILSHEVAVDGAEAVAAL